ncbi:phosphatidylinositol mannoside acyltransferase [Actinoplanes sp. N902-109]|uniref:phosphatidylinositol mannoside acyltransferase n=1 Tax=Actinoplanes sp. (strain N902-109) TaxID=649831 RepID=UPI000329498A|nr:phosphatidylinositol mannoside acyltransferase [Actinoplanes sp. N902-109]AGL19585.1 lipid A biosynthesis lauroyl acyltransferase [Actinoplanes sp. N902-109]
MKDQLTEFGYAAGWRLVRMLPLPVARALFTTGADRAARGNGPGVQRLRGNLRQVVGPQLSEAELDELVRAGLRSYARYWMEAFRLPSLSRQDHLSTFVLEDEAALHAMMAEGKGVILALPHVGNWDAAAAWVVSHGYPLITVAERLKPEKLYRRFMAYRERLGMEVLPLTGGPRAPLDVLGEKAQEGYAVALLADRDLTRTGVDVEFFGGRTKMPPGPALLAIRTGAPLVAADIWFDERVTRARMRRVEPVTEGPLDVRVRQTTQRLADTFAIGIADHPQDWHMLQKVWLGRSATRV